MSELVPLEKGHFHIWMTSSLYTSLYGQNQNSSLQLQQKEEEALLKKKN